MATAQDLMPRETKDKPGVESALIRELADVLNDTGLSEIEFERDGLRLRVARQVLAAASPQPVALHTAAPVPATPRVPLEAAIHPGTVKSPMVGTVYRSAAPGSAPFVDVGTAVVIGQTILIIEAMKTMNHIQATKAGTVTAVMVGDKQPVEFGEPLVVIE